MSRTEFLEVRTSVLIVLEAAHVRKIDEIGGKGNRSAYIRWLIDTVDEKHIRRELDLEQENAVLRKLPTQLNNRITHLERRVIEQKDRIKLLKTGGGEDMSQIEGMRETIEAFRKWRNRLEERGVQVLRGRELDWLKVRARNMDLDPRLLLKYVKDRNNGGNKTARASL